MISGDRCITVDESCCCLVAEVSRGTVVCVGDLTEGAHIVSPWRWADAYDEREIRHYALRVAPAHGLFVIRLTEWLTLELEGYEK